MDEAEFIIEQVIEDLESTLDLGGLGLEQFPKGIWDADHISHLSLRNNSLKEIPLEITYLAKLTQLSLADNQIESIPPEINKLTTLTHLNLKNNGLRELPVELLDLVNLKMLRLEGNQLPLPADIIKRWDRPREILEYYKKYHIIEPEPPPPTLDKKISNLFDDEALDDFIDSLTIPDLPFESLSTLAREDKIDQLIQYHADIDLYEDFVVLLDIYRPGHFEMYLTPAE